MLHIILTPTHWNSTRFSKFVKQTCYQNFEKSHKSTLNQSSNYKGNKFQGKKQNKSLFFEKSIKKAKVGNEVLYIRESLNRI